MSRFGLGSQVKSLGGPALAVVTKALSQPTVTILNKRQTTPKPTVRVNPGIGAIGASGLSRIIATGGVTATPSTLTTIASPAVTAAAAVATPTTLLPPPPPTSASATTAVATPTVSVSVNPLKRKLEDADDDYDNI
ncbi:hypothetical protein BsWGS_03485 [Bradybaena similaris]